jgi:predicted anti-sigma-YlaC factor YlaD
MTGSFQSTMDCKRCQENLSALVDGALSEHEAGAVLLHLSDCAECSRHRDEIVALKRLLENVVTPDAGPEFWNATFDRLGPAVERSRSLARRTMRLRLAGASVAAAVLTIGMWRTQTQIQFVPAGSLHKTVVEVSTFDPSSLISLHATMRATRPLADTGKVRFAISEANARDYATDDSLDSL